MLFTPGRIYLLEEKIAKTGNRKNETQYLLCQQSVKKHNFILLRGTREQEGTSNNLLLQRFVTAHLSPFN